MEKQITNNLLNQVSEAWQKLQLDDKIAEKDKLEQEIADPNLWNNPEEARAKTEKFAKLQDEITPWQNLKNSAQDLQELAALSDDSLKDELESQISELETTFETLKKALRFTGPYDHSNAVLRITSGAGGTEAMDWAGMLERMYQRYCELKALKNCKDVDVHKATGIAKSTLSDWKNGKSTPKQDKLKKIADYFDVSVDYLMTGKTNMLFETAKQDAALSNMDDTLKKYALKLSNLTKEQQELVMKMIDQLGE